MGHPRSNGMVPIKPEFRSWGSTRALACGWRRPRLQPPPSHPGRYPVSHSFRPAQSQATNTPVTIRHAGGTAKLTVDQRKEVTPFNFVTLGEFTCKAGNGGFLEVSNANADGRVAIDGALGLAG